MMSSDSVSGRAGTTTQRRSAGSLICSRQLISKELSEIQL